MFLASTHRSVRGRLVSKRPTLGRLRLVGLVLLSSALDPGEKEE